MQRKDYVALPSTQANHRTYYAQFVTDDVIELVLVRIGKPTIMASEDPSFNDIPLRRWDNLAPAIWSLCRTKLRETGEGTSLASAGCIAKEAARQIRESG